MNRKILALTGLPRMLEDMIQQTFHQCAEVQVEIYGDDDVISLQEKIFCNRPFDSLITVLQEPGKGDEWIRKSLAANPHGIVICLNNDASRAKIYNYQIAMTETELINVESLPTLLSQNISWFH